MMTTFWGVKTALLAPLEAQLIRQSYTITAPMHICNHPAGKRNGQKPPFRALFPLSVAAMDVYHAVHLVLVHILTFNTYKTKITNQLS